MMNPPSPLDTHTPSPAWWMNPYSIVHGLDHAARVLLWAELVARALIAGGRDIDLAVVRWSVILHDTRRHDDGPDPGHGARAAEWIGREGARLLPGLTNEQVRKVQHNVRWQVPPDSACPRMTNELRYLKDADGLDRCRLNDFDPSYLRFPTLCDREADALALIHETARLQPRFAWRAVRHTVRALGRWPTFEPTGPTFPSDAGRAVTLQPAPTAS